MKFETPREPTRQEFDELVMAYAKRYGCGVTQDDNALYASYIAIFDNYITGGPGWTGKLAIIAFDGSPEYTQSWGKKKDDDWEFFSTGGHCDCSLETSHDVYDV